VKHNAPRFLSDSRTLALGLGMLAAGLAGCSGTGSSPGSGGATAGSAIVGGSISAGGSLGGDGSSLGGAGGDTETSGSSSGGSTGTGGSTVEPMGGATSAGGASGRGGATSAGGTTGSAGTGGSTVGPMGGATSTGGSSSRGGAAGAGGAAGSGSGGISDFGGSRGSGGSNTTGGAAGSGGSTGTGGATARGGAIDTGGATGAGGAPGPVTTTCPGAAPAGITPDWCSCDQWGQWTRGNATYYNDLWGPSAGIAAGPQCIWVAGTQWGVAANHPDTSGVKAYPNISYSPALTISAISAYTSSFQVTVPSSGAWEVAYDIWVKNGSTEIEIMLWVNYTQGKVFPAGSLGVSNVSTGGHTWNVYYGAYGGHDVISLLRTTNAASATVDVKDILNWLIANKKTFNSTWSLDQVQFGPEIVSDGSVQSFVVNSFSVSSS